MFAIITTDEYKELLDAKKDYENLSEDCDKLCKMLREANESLTEILQLLTKGGKEPEIGVTYESWDILSTDEIAKYINEHYVAVADGKLQFMKVKENNNE